MYETRVCTRTHTQLTFTGNIVYKKKTKMTANFFTVIANLHNIFTIVSQV